jgi:hypothetical protein
MAMVRAQAEFLASFATPNQDPQSQTVGNGALL